MRSICEDDSPDPLTHVSRSGSESESELGFAFAGPLFPSIIGTQHMSRYILDHKGCSQKNQGKHGVEASRPGRRLQPCRASGSNP